MMIARTAGFGDRPLRGVWFEIKLKHWTNPRGRHNQGRGKQGWNEVKSNRMSFRVISSSVVYRVIPRYAGYGIGRTTVSTMKFDRFATRNPRNEQWDQYTNNPRWLGRYWIEFRSKKNHRGVCSSYQPRSMTFLIIKTDQTNIKPEIDAWKTFIYDR